MENAENIAALWKIAESLWLTAAVFLTLLYFSSKPGARPLFLAIGAGVSLGIFYYLAF